MEQFSQDVLQNIKSYYYKLINLTPKLLLAIGVLILFWFLASRLRAFSDARLQRRMRDPLLANFMANMVKAFVIILGILFTFRIVGLTGMAATLLAGAGISAFIIGFALKDIGENFLAGILLAFKRPFTVGDIIESNGVKGKVITLNLRDIQIKSQGKDIYIPNALLIKNTLINFNRGGYLLQDFAIGIAYGSDYNQALELIKKVLEEVTELPGKEYFNSVVVSGISGNTVQISIHYWVKTDRQVSDGKSRSKVLVSVLNVLKENGFELK